MSEQPPRTQPEYDVFVSYSPSDRAWVEGYLLDALDATDPQNWTEAVARLCSALHAVLPVPATRPQCPYPGMRAFWEQDATHLLDLTHRSGPQLVANVFRVRTRKEGT